jgi:hypothetical protein
LQGGEFQEAELEEEGEECSSDDEEVCYCTARYYLYFRVLKNGTIHTELCQWIKDTSRLLAHHQNSSLMHILLVE